MPSGAFRALRPIILASSSPRRRELLGSLGIDFTIKVVDGSEPAPTREDDPAAYVMRAAPSQGRSRSPRRRARNADAVVLGSDTIVVLHEEHGPIILGKPASRDEALAMLLHLSGRTHTVYTGCCIIWLSARGESRTELFYDAADVTFAEWPEDVLRAYAATGECDDKAGSYAIQGLGSFLVSGIKGQWATIVASPYLPWRKGLWLGEVSLLVTVWEQILYRNRGHPHPILSRMQDQSWTYPSPCLRLYFGLGGSVHHSSWHGNCP